MWSLYSVVELGENSGIRYAHVEIIKAQREIFISTAKRNLNDKMLSTLNESEKFNVESKTKILSFQLIL